MSTSTSGKILSEQTLAIITDLQQNEVTERQIYLNLAKGSRKNRIGLH